MTTHVSFIADNNTLARVCEILNQKPIIALDTEFIRTDTFYPIPALLQVYDGQQCYLIDLTTISDFAALRQLFRNISVVKVLHSCSEDLEVFDNLLQILPEPLYDTQIAAAFLGYGFSIGYSRLVKTLFDIEPPKDESRSNWLQRPLSADQIEYAALDVIHLYEIYLNFQTRLAGSEKQAWLEESHREFINNYRNNQQPAHYFQRIKNTWRLSGEQRKILLDLCLWREFEARKQNKPRNRILRDEVVFNYAQKGTYPPKFSAVNHSAAVPEIENPLPRETGDLVKQLKQLVESQATQLNIAPEILARKKDLTSFIGSGVEFSGQYQLPETLSGWRKAIIGDAFLKTARQWHQTHYTNK